MGIVKTKQWNTLPRNNDPRKKRPTGRLSSKPTARLVMVSCSASLPFESLRDIGH